MHKHRYLIMLALVGSLLLLVGLILGIRESRAATVQFGCPQTLTVRTGQDFYFTAVITDALDLYAWQMDFSYSTTYLEFKYIVLGDFLKRDGTADYYLPPTLSTGLLDNIAATRLSSDTGMNGNGDIVYLVFKALKDTGTGTTNPDIVNSFLVDRNTRIMDKTLVDSGNCRVAIDDDAPIIIQPPIGETIYLPLVLD